MDHECTRVLLCNSFFLLISLRCSSDHDLPSCPRLAFIVIAFSWSMAVWSPLRRHVLSGIIFTIMSHQSRETTRLRTEKKSGS